MATKYYVTYKQFIFWSNLITLKYVWFIQTILGVDTVPYSGTQSGRRKRIYLECGKREMLHCEVQFYGELSQINHCLLQCNTSSETQKPRQWNTNTVTVHPRRSQISHSTHVSSCCHWKGDASSKNKTFPHTFLFASTLKFKNIHYISP
jgi:hypothetical protein